MRQVANQSKNRIVFFRRHFNRFGAHKSPRFMRLADGIGIGAGGA